MKTKLVYVLTCAPEGNYIEQALMSVWSARHWNPDAHIVLITDNLTDQLFVGKRAEILDYISEKIVVPFEDDSLSMVYRSRWLKTSVRQLIKGDFLFIDCDTIVCKSLAGGDSFDKEICAVRDSNVDFKDDNGVVSNNNRYEFMGQLETKAGNTGWMNPLDWSVDLGNGWRRSYYTTENDGYNVSDLKNLNIFLSKSRKNTSGDSLSSIYIDNVRLYDTNIANLNKMNVAKSQDAFDITGCKVEDGKMYMRVKKGEDVDFKVGSSSNASDVASKAMSLLKNGFKHCGVIYLKDGSPRNAYEYIE